MQISGVRTELAIPAGAEVNAYGTNIQSGTFLNIGQSSAVRPDGIPDGPEPEVPTDLAKSYHHQKPGTFDLADIIGSYFFSSVKEKQPPVA